jgi:hypothetical protein
MAAARQKSAAKQSAPKQSAAKQPSAELEKERFAMIECAVKALIVAHPNRGDLRTIFDALYEEHRIAQNQSPTPSDPAVLAMLAALFQTDAASDSV